MKVKVAGSFLFASSDLTYNLFTLWIRDVNKLLCSFANGLLAQAFTDSRFIAIVRRFKPPLKYQNVTIKRNFNATKT